jgi:hypothetical protein
MHSQADSLDKVCLDNSSSAFALHAGSDGTLHSFVDAALLLEFDDSDSSIPFGTSCSSAGSAIRGFDKAFAIVGVCELYRC